LTVIAFSLALFAGAATGQNMAPPPPRGEQAKAVDKRDAIVRELGLSDEQKAQLRDLNKERRPQVQAAQRRFREAMKALDATIYADVFDEYAYGQRLAELQKAQAEVQRLRFEAEVSIRRILTQPQLEKFRELRRRFAAERKLQGPAGDKLRDRPAIRRMQRRQGQPLARPVVQPAKPQ